MAQLNAIKTDSQKSNDGIWVDFEEGIRLKVARLHNAEYDKYLQRISKPYLRKIRTNTLNRDITADLTKQAVAKHILLDWENIEDESGDPIPYSSEKALEFFRDPDLSELYNFVLETADANELYRQELKEDSEKN